MKYKLINKQTGEEHICEKVVIDGWDYYVSDEKGQVGDIVVEKYVDGTIGLEQIDTLNDIDLLLQKKVIATNNPDIDIPKVVELLDYETNKYSEITEEPQRIIGFALGYNKHQETHPFSEEDVIDFATFRNGGDVREEFNLWKEQRTKTLYYE